MTRWRHPHTLAVGFAAGLILSGRWWGYLLAVCFGVCVGRLWWLAGRAAHAAAARLRDSHRARLAVDRARRFELVSRALYRRRTRAAQDAEVKKAYWQGAIDGAPETRR